MNKGKIIIFTLLTLAVSLILIFIFYPTIAWYFLFDDSQRQFTALAGEKLEQKIEQMAAESLRKIEAGKHLGPEKKYIDNHEHQIIGEFNQPEFLLQNYYRGVYLKNRRIKDRILIKTSGYYAYFPLITVTLQAVIKDESVYDGPQEIDDRIKRRLIKKIVSVGQIKDITGNDLVYTVILKEVNPDLDINNLFVTEGQGRLDFKIVSKEGTGIFEGLQEKAQAENINLFDSQGLLLDEYRGMLPPGVVCLPQNSFYALDEDDKMNYYIVEEKNLFPGGFIIIESDVSANSLGNGVLDITFDKAGANRFFQITRDNVGKQLAITYEQMVLTAPVIQEAIPGGKVQITLPKADLNKIFKLANLIKFEDGNISFDVKSIE